MVNKFRLIEQREGKSMARILREQYQIHGNQKDVAKALGVSQPSISLWLAKLALVEKTIVVPKHSDRTAQE